MSSGAGAGSAVPGWSSMAGSSTSMTVRSQPSSRVGQRGGGDGGDRCGVVDHERDPGRGQRGVDRQIRRPGLEHRQHRHDRLRGALQQQCHAPTRARTRARTASAPTGSRPHPAHGTSATVPQRSPPPRPGVRATCTANNSGIDTARAGAVNTARLPNSSKPGVLTLVEHIDRRQPRLGSAVIATNTRSQPLDQGVDAGRVEHVGVEFEAKAQFSARHGLQCQRVVVGFTGGELGDGQLVGACQCARCRAGSSRRRTGCRTVGRGRWRGGSR